MTYNWKEITDPEELFRLKREAWEIEIYTSMGWGKWNGKVWNDSLKFRVRPPQPKMKKVKMLCWITTTKRLVWEIEGCSGSYGWVRVPSEDKEIEVPDDN